MLANVATMMSDIIMLANVAIMMSGRQSFISLINLLLQELFFIVKYAVQLKLNEPQFVFCHTVDELDTYCKSTFACEREDVTPMQF